MYYQPYFPVTTQQQQLDGTAYGFYLVRESDSKRFFISKVVDLQAFAKVCSNVLSNASGWGYWIDKSLGTDADGKPAWVNVDQSGRFT